MSAASTLNGSAGTLRHLPLDRHPDETLHDFLLRRHDEMASELVTLHAQIAWQAESLHAQHHAAYRRSKWLIASLALDATFAVLLSLLWIFDTLPALCSGIALAVLLSGSALALGVPHIEPGLERLRSWRRR
jgi:hypothetical protein